jgi:hypothetical protein
MLWVSTSCLLITPTKALPRTAIAVLRAQLNLGHHARQLTDPTHAGTQAQGTRTSRKRLRQSSLASTAQIALLLVPR